MEVGREGGGLLLRPLREGVFQPHHDPAVLRLDPGCGFRTLETARHPHFSPRPPSSPEPRSCAVSTALPDSQPFRARSPGTSSSPRDKAVTRAAGPADPGRALGSAAWQGACHGYRPPRALLRGWHCLGVRVW